MYGVCYICKDKERLDRQNAVKPKTFQMTLINSLIFYVVVFLIQSRHLNYANNGAYASISFIMHDKLLQQQFAPIRTNHKSNMDVKKTVTIVVDFISYKNMDCIFESCNNRYRLFSDKCI